MKTALSQKQSRSLLDDKTTHQKLLLNYQKNKGQDHTAKIDDAVSRFRYEDCRNDYWNPENYSLLYGTPLWTQASSSQRVVLNQLYWVAYYCQIISAEIATIFLNQTSAAGLYSLEDFRLVCDTLDLETSQERAHIHAFKTIGEEVESVLFGERIFTYPMRSMYVDTMLFQNSNRVKTFWRNMQLRAFVLLSSSNAFLGCQYFTVRGLRTLNGKMIQHALAQYYMKHPEKEKTPIPSQISYFHFMDESYHFNSSCVISHDVINSLKPPTAFESWVANRGIMGCQRDHFNFSVAIKGIFWFDPALYGSLYKILQSRVFGMEPKEAKEMIRKCFTEESAAMHESYNVHRTTIDSYKAYLAPLTYVNQENRGMRIMERNSLEHSLNTNRAAYRRFVNVL
jgi:hypothetical protein